MNLKIKKKDNVGTDGGGGGGGGVGVGVGDESIEGGGLTSLLDFVSGCRGRRWILSPPPLVVACLYIRDIFQQSFERDPNFPDNSTGCVTGSVEAFAGAALRLMNNGVAGSVWIGE